MIGFLTLGCIFVILMYAITLHHIRSTSPKSEREKLVGLRWKATKYLMNDLSSTQMGRISDHIRYIDSRIDIEDRKADMMLGM